MYITPTELASHHHDALDHFHKAADAWLGAAASIANAGNRLARATLRHGITFQSIPASPFHQRGKTLAALRDEAAAAAEASLEACNALVAGLAETARAQRQRLDSLLIASLERGARMTPGELQHLFRSAEQQLLAVEHTVDDVSVAGVEGIRTAARQVESLIEAPRPATRPRIRKAIPAVSAAATRATTSPKKSPRRK